MRTQPYALTLSGAACPGRDLGQVSLPPPPHIRQRVSLPHHTLGAVETHPLMGGTLTPQRGTLRVERPAHLGRLAAHAPNTSGRAAFHSIHFCERKPVWRPCM